MNKKIRIALILSIIFLLLGVSVYFTIKILNNKKIEEEKNNVLKNANNLVKEISSICEKQKNSETDGEFIFKYIIEKGKIDYLLENDIVLPNSGIVEVNDNCEVAVSAVFGEYAVLKNYTSDVKLETKVYSNGDIIYFNPTTGEKCNDYLEENSLNGSVNGCLKWYVINDYTNKNVVSLLLDHNIASGVRWLSEKDYKDNAQEGNTYDNSLGPLTLKNRIEQSIDWKVSYRLPTLSEMLNVIDVNLNKVSGEEVFFDSKESQPLKKCYKGDVSDCAYSWLYDRTSLTCKDYGCSNNSSIETYGYWLEDSSSINNMKAFRIYHDGRITTSKINDLSSGIRLIIDVQKSLLK